jgi:NAD(P)-dependent dehydrogenase (short-subunit alcohol dehydrogenase family)
MADNNVWFITGAGRGLGIDIDIAKSALAAGHKVIATGRNVDKVLGAIGEHENLLTVALDITDPTAAADAAKAAVDRFGRIDVLVNNAGNFYAGYFENISDAQLRKQMETNFFGPLNVTRAILPVMRKQRSGQVITVTSAAGLMGQEFVAAYAASKFALEGWMESLRYDVEPYGIKTMAVEPGFFRTELLVEGSSTIWPELEIEDYAERTSETITAWSSMNGLQGGDPKKLAKALVTLSDSGELPLRFLAGADVMGGVEANLATIQGQIDAHRDLSASLNYED